jgi:hypothetical protein
MTLNDGTGHRPRCRPFIGPAVTNGVRHDPAELGRLGPAAARHGPAAFDCLTPPLSAGLLRSSARGWPSRRSGDRLAEGDLGLDDEVGDGGHLHVA